MQRAQLILCSIVAGVLLVPIDGIAAQYRNLCASMPGVCEYTGPDAPRLNADVCVSARKVITLKGASACAAGSRGYHVVYGEIVDPLTNRIAAYIPLNDACDKPGLCVDGPAPGGAQEWPMCCNGDYVCTHGTLNCGGTKWFCHDGVCNEDGTITCFNAEEL